MHATGQFGRRAICRAAAGMLLFLFLGACQAASAASPAEPAAQPTLAATLPTPTPAATPVAPPTALPFEPTAPAAAAQSTAPLQDPANLYLSQPGDTFRTIAGRFGLLPADLTCRTWLPRLCPQPGPDVESDPGFDPDLLLPAGLEILYPEVVALGEPAAWLLPDSEIVFSSAASGFDVEAYVQAAQGYLAGHRQYLMMNAWNTGAEIVELVAEENSINPRLLLALLEYQCGCVLGQADQPEPYLGADFYVRHDLYGQLVWAVYELSNGYYGWRAGALRQVILPDGTLIALDPRLNAGTVALYTVFAGLYGAEEYRQALDPASGFPALYARMFGSPWSRAQVIIPDGTSQPALDLPFEPGQIWSYTGGPHPAFEGNGPLAALDFAPASAEPGCQPTPAWVTAAAAGLVVRSEFGLVVQDLDGDGDEHTGWTLLYLHIGEDGRVPVGTYLDAGDRIGQPSCEGGRTNGTHVHFARLLNGEWVPAGSGPLPFNLDGWIARDGVEPYKGFLQREHITLEACTCSWRLGWLENE